MNKEMSNDEIFKILKGALIELFEIDESKITLESQIYDDLDIDSIDAIDLVDFIKKKTGYRMEASDFREVRTLENIVEVVAKQLQNAKDS